MEKPIQILPSVARSPNLSFENLSLSSSSSSIVAGDDMHIPRGTGNIAERVQYNDNYQFSNYSYQQSEKFGNNHRSLFPVKESIQRPKADLLVRREYPNDLRLENVDTAKSHAPVYIIRTNSGNSVPMNSPEQPVTPLFNYVKLDFSKFLSNPNSPYSNNPKLTTEDQNSPYSPTKGDDNNYYNSHENNQSEQSTFPIVDQLNINISYKNEENTETVENPPPTAIDASTFDEVDFEDIDDLEEYLYRTPTPQGFFRV